MILIAVFQETTQHAVLSAFLVEHAKQMELVLVINVHQEIMQHVADGALNLEELVILVAAASAIKNAHQVTQVHARHVQMEVHQTAAQRDNATVHLQTIATAL